jgi:hypothetical protein
MQFTIEGLAPRVHVVITVFDFLPMFGEKKLCFSGKAILSYCRHKPAAIWDKIAKFLSRTISLK